MKLSEKTKGILLIICAAACFAGMSSMVRLSGDIPTMEKALFRNLIASIVVLVPFLKEKTDMHLAPGAWKYVLLRAICGTIGLVLNFYAIDRINLADANILNKLSPVFAVVFSIFIIGERPKTFQVAMVITALIGAVFVVKPGGTSVPFLPGIAGFTGGLAAGLAYTLLRKAKLMGVPSNLIILCFSTLSVIVIAPFAAANFVVPTLRQLIFLLLCGVFAAGGQIFITAAYAHAPAREISIYDYSQVIIAAILGFFLFDQIPDIYSFIGYIIIIGSSLANFLYNKRTAA